MDLKIVRKPVLDFLSIMKNTDKITRVKQNLLQLPFDQYGRYKIIADFINNNKGKNKNIKILDIGKWMKQNGEGIYNTRPWLVFGEDPVTKMNSKANKSPYTAGNIRFTRSKDGRNIYIIALGWLDKKREALSPTLEN